MSNKFQPRLTRPGKDNKYYKTVGTGGYSTAIKGSPTDSQCDVLANCTGYSFGRFNEIAFQMLGAEGIKKLFKENGGTLKDLKSNNNMPLLQPLNAENFYDVALSQGLEITQTPTVGACMCWQKGNTRSYTDGAGHVAIVEEVVGPTCVRTSESGWGCTNPFWTQLRYKGNGNWGAGNDYKFLGFIKNPAVDTDADPYPVPTRILQEGLVGEDVKWVQWKLRELGYTKDAIDGWFGLLTYCAVAGFQLKNGLEVDAIVGPATVSALQKADKVGQSVWKV